MLSCAPAAPGPATPGSPSAALAERAYALGVQALDAAARADALASRFDALRTAPVGDRPAAIAALREEATALSQLASELRATTIAIEASAETW